MGKTPEITYQHINELKYCAATWKESMRLDPSVGAVFRLSPEEEITLGGFKIPPKTGLIVIC